jgi:hypothetical protein
VATDSAQKLFAVSNRFGVATFGWGLLGGNTIAGIMEEFEAQTKRADDVMRRWSGSRSTSRIGLRATSKRSWTSRRPTESTFSGLVVGGYDDSGVGRLRTLDVRNLSAWPEPDDVRRSES